jgi:hypothetical protein
MRACLAAALAGLLQYAPAAQAQTAHGCFVNERAKGSGDTAYLCTQVYQITGPCDGSDAVQKVTITGTPPQTDWRIRVWEPVPIIIRGIELAQIAGASVQWAMAGNNSWPDIMLMLARGMSYNRVAFATGTGMPLPGLSTATDRDYLDFHIVCKGDPFLFWYKIDYTANSPSTKTTP